ncbi:hypothetical protein BpHYR1_042490 [Brachionus plicatilis]|uniref:Uncharacterized protein n=1 Tax=Brachionus plicatilis TaxID=10195 RepID=A0A3M7SXE5_BRAPC|nr:hypothetical protein BpHYR1_042490 [Brachionus plicatilis]
MWRGIRIVFGSFRLKNSYMIGWIEKGSRNKLSQSFYEFYPIFSYSSYPNIKFIENKMKKALIEPSLKPVRHVWGHVYS